MIAQFPSTLSMSEVMRTAIAKAQVRMTEAQTELSTGRHADAGLALGAGVGRTVSLRGEHAQLSAIIDTNARLAPRLETTQGVLKGVSESAARIQAAVIAARTSPQGIGALKAAAQDALKSLTASLNTSYDGQYLFAGDNVGSAPLADYFAVPASASKSAVDGAFLSQFGLAQGSAGTEAISASAMQTFLDGQLTAQFDAPAWTSNWSLASDSPLMSRVAPNETLASSASANETPMRKLAMAFTMLADLGIDTLSTDTAQTVLDKATSLIGDATAGLSAISGRIGTVQSRASDASDRLSARLDILDQNVSKLEDVDPAEVSVRISSLTTQLETSYALTARLQQLSLVKYL